MRFIHTSDWHLGVSLYTRKRYDEFEQFFAWLTDSIRSRGARLLFIAGDIFDTGTPSNRAQEQYFRFLKEAAAAGCEHIVVVGGNHDSPMMLDAPKALLKSLSVHVVGSRSESVADDVLILPSVEAPEMIVCAVPYLRDRDVRKAEVGEAADDKNRKLVEGIAEYYRVVVAHAETVRKDLGVDVPIVATGHLFAAGGSVAEGEKVRDLYVGNLGHISGDAFPETCAYVALGHLHSAQKVAGKEHIRYSGSPLPMSFDEVKQQKYILDVTCENGKTSVTQIPVPLFQRMEQVSGTLAAIEKRLMELMGTGESVWVEVTYTGDDYIPDLQNRLLGLTEQSGTEVLCVRKAVRGAALLTAQAPDESLDDLPPEEVFLRRLDAEEIEGERRESLLAVYHEAIFAMENGGEDEA